MKRTISFIVTLLWISISYGAVHQINFYEYHGTYDANGILPGGEREVDVVIRTFNASTAQRNLGVRLFSILGDIGVYKGSTYYVLGVDRNWNRVIYIDYENRKFAVFRQFEPIAGVIGADGRIYIVASVSERVLRKEVVILRYDEASGSLVKVREIKDIDIQFGCATDILYNDNGTPYNISDDYFVVFTAFPPVFYKFSRNGDLIKRVDLSRLDPSYYDLFYGFRRGVFGKKFNPRWGVTNTPDLHILVKNIKEPHAYNAYGSNRYIHIKGDIFSDNPQFTIDTISLEGGFQDIEVNSFGDVFISNYKKNYILHISGDRVIGKLKKEDRSYYFPGPYAMGTIGDQFFSASWWFICGVSRYVFVTTLDTFFLYGPDSVIPTKTEAYMVFKISDWGKVRYEVIDSITGEVKLVEEEVESPGYHFRAFDGVGRNGTLPDGVYGLRIIAKSLFGERKVDPPDTAILYVRVYQSENYHVISPGVTGAAFFHNIEYSVTRVIDTTTAGEVLTKVTLHRGYTPYHYYWATTLSDREELMLSPFLSSNDSVLIFSIPDSVVIIENPLLYYDPYMNMKINPCGEFPAISPCGDKLIYYRNSSIIVEDWRHREILETFSIPGVKFLRFHPYHDVFLYSKGKDLFIHTPNGDSLIFHVDVGEIEEACYYPDGIKMLLLISDSTGKKILHFDPLRSETLVVEESQMLRGISVTPDGRFITYSQGRYVIGFPAGKIRKEPLVLVKSPLVGDGVEQKVIIRGTVVDNISPDTETVYAHLSSFRVEWGYGEYPEEFSTEGITYPNGQGEVIDDILAEIIPPFRTGKITIKVTAYSLEGDSAIRYVWVNFSPLKLTWWGNYSFEDNIDSYCDTLHMHISLMDTTDVNVLRAEIMRNDSVIYVIDKFNDPVWDTGWAYFTTYDLRDSVGKFLEGEDYSLIAWVTKAEDTVSTLRKHFTIHHYSLVTDDRSATYPPQVRHLEILPCTDTSSCIDSLYLTYLSKGDVFLAKGIRWYEIQPEKEKWIVYYDSIIATKPLSNNKLDDYYPSILLDTLERKLFVAWGDETGTLHLYEENLTDNRSREYKLGLWGKIIFTDIEKVDSTIYMVYSGTFSRRTFLGLVKFNNANFDILRRWEFESKLCLPDLATAGGNLYLAIKKGKDLRLYHIPDWDSINIRKEIEDSLPHDTFDITNFALGEVESNPDLILLLARKDKAGLVLSILKDSVLNTVSFQHVDSSFEEYTEAVISKDWLDIVGYSSAENWDYRVIFGWDTCSEGWCELSRDHHLTNSIFRSGITYGGVVGYWYNGPINFIELCHNMEWKYRTEKVNTNFEEKISYNFFKPYPNPASEDMNFKFVLPEKDKVVMEIYTIEGRCIGRLEKVYEAGYHVLKLSAILPQNKMPSGVYFYRFKYRGKKEKGKFVWIKRSTSP